jgi:hypothetical protein
MATKQEIEANINYHKALIVSYKESISLCENRIEQYSKELEAKKTVFKPGYVYKQVGPGASTAVFLILTLKGSPEELRYTCLHWDTGYLDKLVLNPEHYEEIGTLKHYLNGLHRLSE